MSAELDAICCKFLDIESIGERYEGRWIRNWPALSTTGEGMLLLMEALLAKGYGSEVTISVITGCWGSAWHPEASKKLDAKTHADSAPMALALAVKELAERRNITNE